MTNDETQIRTLIEDWAAAVRAGDMAGVLANHTDDILIFDVPEPLYSRGMEAYRRTWELFFRYSRGGPGAFDLSEIAVTVGGDVAFVTAIPTIAGPGPLRLTLGLRKEGGRWLIAHEHHSYAAKLGEGDAP
jgi:uncharacterized protein (TIGR02246 family)